MPQHLNPTPKPRALSVSLDPRDTGHGVTMNLSLGGDLVGPAGALSGPVRIHRISVGSTAMRGDRPGKTGMGFGGRAATVAILA